MAPKSILIEHVYSFGLYEIRRLLEAAGSSLQVMQLPAPQHDFIETLANETNSIIRDKLLHNVEDLQELVNRDFPLANAD